MNSRCRLHGEGKISVIVSTSRRRGRYASDDRAYTLCTLDERTLQGGDGLTKKQEEASQLSLVKIFEIKSLQSSRSRIVTLVSNCTATSPSDRPNSRCQYRALYLLTDAIYFGHEMSLPSNARKSTQTFQVERSEFCVPPQSQMILPLDSDRGEHDRLFIRENGEEKAECSGVWCTTLCLR